MHRKLISIGCLLLALIAVPFGAARAQDGGFGAEEQAALDSARSAVETFFTAQTYTVSHTQSLAQQIAVSLGTEAITIDQTIDQQGTTTSERQPDNRFDNQTSTLDQTITQTLRGAQPGQEQTLSLAQTLDMIVLDDRAYLRITTDDPQLAGFFPEGWVDITEGAEAFPGMELYDIEQLLASNSSEFSAEMFEALFGAVSEVELLESETVGDVTARRVRLVLDPVVAFSGEGSASLREMFNAAALPIDVDGLIEVIFTDEDTHYEITLLLGDEDGALYGYDVILDMDIAIPAELVTDPSLAGAQMSLAQQSVSTLRFSNLNEPADISAPPLEEPETEG
jgi:hypothetical protein